MDNQTVKIPYILFTLGFLQAYSMRTISDVSPIDNYYWRDQNSPRGFGPFTTLHECMTHYASTVKMFRAITEPPKLVKNNVVYVDFINKRRIG